MNLLKMQADQAEYDQKVFEMRGGVTGDELFEKTIAALMVELAELANASEHFKHWKKKKGKIDTKRFKVISDGRVYFDTATNCVELKKSARRLTILEEASDALHFILSLANQVGFELGENIKTIYEEEPSLEKVFIAMNYTVFCLAFVYKAEPEKDGLFVQSVYNDFIDYVTALGFTLEELEEAYYVKHEMLYERLKNDY